MDIDIEPTLNDEAVMTFVFEGYILLEGVVDAAFNRECLDIPGGWMGNFVQTEECRRKVLLHPTVAGVVRSLLGSNFYVPIRAHHHMFETPHQGQTRHSDGLTEPGYGITHLQCYYYPSGRRH